MTTAPIHDTTFTTKLGKVEEITSPNISVSFTT